MARQSVSEKLKYFTLFALLTVTLGENVAPLKCPSGIKKFGHAERRLYYTCDDGPDSIPTLRECPPGEIYHLSKKTCMEKVAAEGDIKPITDKALGRNFQLGSLYDARLNMFFPESSLWNRAKLLDQGYRYELKETNIEVTTATSTLEKANSLDISASLAVDFMDGMVSVSGSGGYLRHERTSDDEAMVELNYHSVKYAETIHKATPIDYDFECNNPAFTHAVTSIKYGTDAYFVFSRMTQEGESQSTVTGDLSISVNLMGGKNNGSDGGGNGGTGHGNVNMTEEEKFLMSTTRLTLYGDISPEYKIPSTYEDALEFYQTDLPKLAGTKEDNYLGAQRVEVHLTPLQDICGPIEAILNDISDDIMDKTLTMLDDLERLTVTVTGFLNTREAIKFKPIRENLNLYKNKLALFQLDVKGQLTQILPNVRGGTGHGEEDLVTLVNTYTESPFFYDTSSLFLSDRHREIKAVQFLVDNFPEESNIAVADYESANDVEYIFERKEIILLDFNLLTTTDHTLAFLDGQHVNEDDFWYNKVDLNGEVGFKLRSLWAFAMDNVDQAEKGYMVKLSNLDQEVPYQMNALIKGQVLTDAFEVPILDIVPLIYDLEDSSFKFKIPKVNRFVTGIRIFVSDVIGGVNYQWDEEVHHSVSDGELVEVVVGGLKPAHVYRFNVKYLTAVGTSIPSAPIKPFSTRPFSEAQSLSVDKIDRKNIVVSWEPPSVMAPEISASDILYEVTISGENGFRSTVIVDKTSYTLGQGNGESWDLIEATKYTFTVRAVLSKELLESGDLGDFGNFTQLNIDMDIAIESVPVTVSACSLPLPPSLVPVEEVTLSTAVVRWTPPARLAEGASILHYVLEYTPSNGNGTESLLPGTTQRLVVDGTSVQLEELYTGGKYNFTVKVVTTEGESEFANNLFFSTLYNEDDIGSVRTEVKSAIDQVKNNIKLTSDFCGYQASHTSDGVIPFHMVDQAINNVAGSDLALSGHFTAGVTGVYQVSVNVEMQTDSGDEHSVWVRMNDQNLIQYSRLHTSLSSMVTGSTSDNAGRSILVSLTAGDTLCLFHDVPKGRLQNVSFCISGVQLY